MSQTELALLANQTLGNPWGLETSWSRAIDSVGTTNADTFRRVIAEPVCRQIAQGSLTAAPFARHLAEKFAAGPLVVDGEFVSIEDDDYPTTFICTGYVPAVRYNYIDVDILEPGLLEYDYSAIIDPTLMGGSSPYQVVLIEEYLRALKGLQPANDQNFVDPADQLLAEVGRLKDGWGGPDSIAPSQELRRTLAEILALLDPFISRAQPDVDPSGGEVSLKWFSSDNRSVFSVTVLRNATTIASLTSLDRPGEHWTFEPNRLSALPYLLGHIDFMNVEP